MKEVMNGTYFKGEESFNFDFYTDINVANKAKFVNSVVDLVVDGNNYNSVIRDLVFNFYIVDIFTNVDTTELKQSHFFLNDVEQFLEETNIVDIVEVNAKDGLIKELNKAVNQSIEYRTGIHPNPLNEALTELVATLEKKIDGIDLNSMMGMAQKFVGMTEELTPENVMEAYMNSDIHKKNLNEIAKSKKQREVLAEGLSNVINIATEKAKEDLKRGD